MGFKMKRSNMAGGIMIDRKPDGHGPDYRAKSAPLQFTDDKKKKAEKAKKTISKQSPDLKKAVKKSQEDFVPAYPGADYSKEQIAKMSEKEKIAKIDGYEPKKNKKNKK